MDQPQPMNLPMDAHRRSGAFPPEVIAQIQRTAAEGHYEIRGWGAKRDLPSFDDLLFLTASLTRYPLEGYREKCDTGTVLGTRYASKPLQLAIPVTIAGMSFGALSATAKVALGRAASAALISRVDSSAQLRITGSIRGSPRASARRPGRR